MNFFDLYKKIKIDNAGKVCIIRCGIFYYVLNKDALVLEKYTNIKKICYSINICKVCFPIVSLNKFSNILRLNKVSYVIYSYLDEDFSEFIDLKTFEYKKYIYGKVLESDYGVIDFSKYEKDCFMCKYYEDEITRNINRLSDQIGKYYDELRKFNRYHNER